MGSNRLAVGLEAAVLKRATAFFMGLAGTGLGDAAVLSTLESLPYSVGTDGEYWAWWDGNIGVIGNSLLYSVCDS